MVGNFINHRQSAGTWHPGRILAQLRNEDGTRASIGIQPVDIDSIDYYFDWAKDAPPPLPSFRRNKLKVVESLRYHIN